MQKYSDNDVRGERCYQAARSSERTYIRGLVFTQQAANKYKNLTGSQRTFIDRELDDLKFGQNRTKSRLDNSELKQQIIFEESDQEVLITDILYQPYRQSDNYQRAQIRMENMNK